MVEGMIQFFKAVTEMNKESHKESGIVLEPEGFAGVGQSSQKGDGEAAERPGRN